MAPVNAERVKAAVRELLRAIGEDPERPGLRDTPERFAEAYAELFSGLGQDPIALLRQADTVEAPGGAPIALRDIPFVSTCEHHLLPFSGTANVVYLPATRVIGLGRIPRVIDTLASRPQVQERLTEEIADALDAGLSPRGVLVTLTASHSCVWARGPRKAGTSMVTVAARGALAGGADRGEAMMLLAGGEPPHRRGDE